MKQKRFRTNTRLRIRHTIIIFILIMILAALCMIIYYAAHPSRKNTIRAEAPPLTSGQANSNFSSPSSANLTSSGVLSSKATASSSTSSESSQDDSSAPADKAEPNDPDNYYRDAVFIGDSITGDISSYGIMNDTTILYHNGLSTYNVKNEYYYLGKKTTLIEALSGLGCKKVYILMGVNDMVWMSCDQFIGYYKTLLAQIKNAVPDATIYVQSIFPVTTAYEKQKKLITNQKIEIFNQAIQKLTKEDGYLYLDVASCLKNSSGALPANFSDDGLHLRVNGYKKWFAYLSEHR